MKEIPVSELNINPMTMIGGEWWLVTAGTKDSFNTMTASWGHLGSLWERPGRTAHMGLPTAIVYLRPQRYTKEFLDREELFILSVLGRGCKKALAYLGTHSGREEDKVAAAGLTPVFADGTVHFAQARLVLVCRKLYHAALAETGFVDKSLIEHNYPQKDFHEMYVGEIIKAMVADR